MSFTLTRKEPAHDDATLLQGWPIEIECTDGSPVEIFVYQRGVGEQVGLNDRFSCVASALQIRTLPVGNPTTDEENRLVPFFRKSTLRLNCQNATHALYIWEQVLQQVTDLSDSIAAGESLSNQETVVIP